MHANRTKIPACRTRRQGKTPTETMLWEDHQAFTFTGFAQDIAAPGTTGAPAAGGPFTPALFVQQARVPQLAALLLPVG